MQKNKILFKIAYTLREAWNDWVSPKGSVRNTQSKFEDDAAPAASLWAIFLQSLSAHFTGQKHAVR